MKSLMLVCLLVGTALAMPPRPMSSSAMDGWGESLARLQRIFANPRNAMPLQKLFQGERMGGLIFGSLHKEPPTDFPEELATDWTDDAITKDEFMAWHPHLVKLFQRIGTSPAVPEEWEVADTDQSGLVTPLNLYAMLRDSTTNRFFSSFLTLLFAEATKAMPGPFWTPAKQAAFESLAGGVWAEVGALPELSEKEMEQMGKRIAGSQGPMAAKEFMMAMGMDKAASDEPTIMMMTLDGKGPVAIKVTPPGEAPLKGEPSIDGDAPVQTQDGVKAAAEVAASQSEEEDSPPIVPIPDSLLPVDIGGNKVMLPVAPLELAPEEALPQPMAVLTLQEDAKPEQLPVVDMSLEAGGVASTTIMSPDGRTMTMKAKAPRPKAAIAGLFDAVPGSGQAEPSSAAIVTPDGQEIPAEATEKLVTDEEECIAPDEDGCFLTFDESCGAEEDCAPVELEAAGGEKILAPMKTLPSPPSGPIDMAFDDPEAGAGPSGIEMTLINEATGEKKLLQNAQAEVKDGNLEVSAEDPEDGSVEKVSIPISPDDADESVAEGAKITSEAADGSKTEAEVTALTTSSDPATGAMITEASGVVDGQPITLEIKSQDSSLGLSNADVPDPDKMEMMVMVNDEPPVKAEVVAVDGETATGMLENGMLVIVPTAEEASVADGNPATDGDSIQVEQPGVGKTELPIKSVAKLSANEEILTAESPDGAKVVVDLIEKEGQLSDTDPSVVTTVISAAGN